MDKLVSVFVGDSQMIFNPEKETLLLKSNINLKKEVLDIVYFEIFEQIKKGVVAIPMFMDVVIIPKETEFLVPKESNNG